MKYVGKWFSTYLDTNLDITEDGRVFLTIAQTGDYSAQAEALITDECIELSALGITMKLTMDGDDSLAGSCTRDGKTENITFSKLIYNKVAVEPDALPYHHAEMGEEVPLTDKLAAAELVGSWKTEIPYNTEMNIFVNDGKMKLVLSFDGQTVWNPISVWTDGDDIVWQINDGGNRGVCTIHPEKTDGKTELVGTYRQLFHPPFGEVRFIKKSDAPAEPKEYEPDVAMPDKSRLEILRDNAEYTSDSEIVETEYVLDIQAPDILEKYGYSSYIEGKSGDELAFACLDFICDHFHHYGSSGMPPYGTRSLSDFINWCGEHDNLTNCRGLSIMLAALLRYNGIRGQHVTCMPYEEPFDDCHVVVDCILPSEKRIMLDPTYRLFLRDENGEYVSLPRLREILIDGGTLFANNDAGYNGASRDKFNMPFYREYMSKNTIRFSKDRVNKDGNDEEEPMYLFPSEYPKNKLSLGDSIILTSSSAFWGIL